MLSQHRKRIIGFISNSANREIRLLSNFSDSDVVYQGVEYKTVEHAYHALKYLSECTHGPETNKQRGHDDVKRASTVEDAKRLGGRKGMANYNVTLDLDCWDNRVSVPIMRELILSKIKRHHNVQELLNKYKDCTLVHIAFRGADMKWGVRVDYTDSSKKEIKSVTKGENLLGKIYMEFIQHPELVSRQFEKLIHNLPASPSRNSSPGSSQSYRNSRTSSSSDSDNRTLKSKRKSNKIIGGPPDWPPGTLNPDWELNAELSSTSSRGSTSSKSSTRSRHSSRSKSPKKSPTKKSRPKSAPPRLGDIVYDLTDSS
jgi:ribA/ribD-fused uncharacterized protein